MDNISPLVSIIMSSFENERDVGKAIESVLAQTYTNWELVISDDASQDKTKQIIDSYNDPRIKRFHSKTNRGIVSQMNMLFLQAGGDFITILDADDMIAKNKLEVQLEQFKLNPKISLCLSHVAICDEKDHILKIIDYYPLNNLEIRQFINSKHAFPCGNLACMMFRKSSLLKYGGYQEIYQGIGSWDVDLALRILSDGEVCTVAQVLHFWRKHPFSFSRKINLNPLRNQSHQIAHLLYQQRIKFGKDDVTGLNSGELEKLKTSILKDYQDDPSRIFREICNSKDLPYKVRLKYGIDSITKNPYNITNYRYLLKSLLRK